MEQPNITGIGKKQKEVLMLMAKDNLVIRSLIDYHDLTTDINLENLESNDIHMKLSGNFLESLFTRHLLSRNSFLPSLGIEIITFRLTHQAKTYFI